MSVGCACPGCSSKSFKLYSPKEPPNGNAFPPFHPGTMLDRDVGPTPMYPPTYLEPGIGRHTPYGNQTDYRIFELNKRLQNWTEECDNLWWDAFTTEFFEDDAMLTITFCLEDGPKRYTIGRTLIPRYFRSIFEGGATELYYVLKHPKESFHNNFVSLDCDQCTMVTQHGKPMFTQVCVEGRLYLEFMFDDMMRIKTWHFSIRQHRELIPRSILAMHAQDPQMLDQLSKNITRCGLSNSTLNYLRLCVILEPMQELMSRHKTYSLSPRDCLKTCLFQKWQRMVAPPGESHTACCAAWGLWDCLLRPCPWCRLLPAPELFLALFYKAGGCEPGIWLLSMLVCLPSGAEQGCGQPVLPASRLPAACRKQIRDGNVPAPSPVLWSGRQQSCGGEEGGDTAWRGNVFLEEVGFASKGLEGHRLPLVGTDHVCLHPSPAEPARQQPSKRRKRKMSGGSTMSSGGGNTNNSNSKKKSPASTFALSSQVPDVMVVGEPTLMGGEFGDEDERLITRLENTQFDAANGIDDEDSFNNSPALGANSPWNSKPPSSQESKSENPTSQASQ
uniref:LIM domain binding 1 n=1 Tax=Taeniopygia guttata TaxID=59729 RepID=A0A674H6M7_TAEGU